MRGLRPAAAAGRSKRVELVASGQSVACRLSGVVTGPQEFEVVGVIVVLFLQWFQSR